MKKHLMYAAIFGGVLTLNLWGCKKRNVAEQTKTATAKMKTISAGFAHNEGSIILGDRLINPYTIANMERGKKNLEAKGIYPKNAYTVRETHLYVKFKPKNEEEYNELNADTTLNLVDFPMDYDIKVIGNHYREPGLSDDIPTPQYTTVPSDFVFNENIDYEVVATMYLPEWDHILMGANYDEDYKYLQQLLNETYGFNPPNNRWNMYLQPAETGANDGGGGMTDVNASDGFVRVFDTRLNAMVPLKGANVVALSGMGFLGGWTDNAGEYWLNGWCSGNNIRMVKMKRADFAVRKNFFDGVNIIRPNVGSYCDINIEDGMERMYGTMFRAAERYYYGDVGGLERPKRPVVKQVLVGEDANLDYAGINYGSWPNLRVSRYFSHNGNDVEFGSDEIFGITIHELAHTGHVRSMNAPAQYYQVENRIQESWAVAVQWLVTNMEYREKGIGNYGDWNYNPSGFLRRPHRFGYQNWGSGNATSTDYTSLFINLMDDFNENGVNFNLFGTSTINDPVSGYNLSTIQSGYLKHVYGLSSLSIQLKAHKPAGVTDAQIDILLNNY